MASSIPVARSTGAPSAADYRAPQLMRPLPMLDPALATSGPRPTMLQLAGYQLGTPLQVFDRSAKPDQWPLARPSLAGVRGYAGDVSTAPGGVVELHLSGVDPFARLDVFRMGIRDAEHVTTVARVPIGQQASAQPRLSDGLVEEEWPVTYRLRVPATWRSGMYLVKLTGSSGRDSYVPFIVRATKPSPLMVVLPTMTYQAYNLFGGSSLYAWLNGPRARAYAVSFDRPYGDAYGAGLFFRLDFPLVVWLEDHGYEPTYLADADLARQPALVAGARTLVFSGHSEYWTGSMRNTVEKASLAGTSLAFFGANQAFWQVRLRASGQGSASRQVVCYKSAALDPMTSSSAESATVRFQDPTVGRPPADLMGLEYGGVVARGLQAMTVGSGLAAFVPGSGLSLGERLPGLIGGEIDTPPPGFDGLILTSTPVEVRRPPETNPAVSSVWIRPSGGRVFDAGSFDYSWGLDPRYAAAQPGFPAAAFTDLTARVLGWLGSEPG
jgi:hypothetical protein